MKLHVAVAGWLLGPPSGANRRLERLLAHVGPLLAQGERVTLLHRRGHLPDAPAGVALHPIDVPAGPTARRVLAERRHLESTLHELGATVLDHGFLPLPRVTAATCLLVHDVRAAEGMSRWPRAFARAVLRRACRRAGAIVVPSEFTAQRLAALVPVADNVHVVRNAADPPAAGPTEAPARPVPRNGFLLHVGHVEPRKQLELVVDALALLPESERPELWLAGRDAGALANVQSRALARGCPASVHALGVVSDRELCALYEAARAVVVPSRYEGFGLPALEALSHGRPVLAHAAAALPEVLGGHGVLLPAEPAAWARAIAGASAGDERDRAARRAFAAAHTWHDAAAQLLALWRQLAARG